MKLRERSLQDLVTATQLELPWDVPVSRETEGFIGIVGRRLKLFVRRRERFKEGQGRDPAEDEAVGQVWKDLRKERGLSREQVAAKAGVDPYDLLCFEEGLIPADDMPAGFVGRLATVLGLPGAMAGRIVLIRRARHGTLVVECDVGDGDCATCRYYYAGRCTIVLAERNLPRLATP